MKKIITWLLSFCFLCLCCIGQSNYDFAIAQATDQSSVDYTGKTEIYTFGREAYNSDGTLKDFTPYFVSKHNETGDEANWEDYWTCNFDNGTLTTNYTFIKDDQGKDVSPSEGNAAYLTLNTKRYQYFEAVLKFQYSDLNNPGWIGIIFGQTELGNGYMKAGGGSYAFAQKEGTCTMSGRLISATAEGFQPSSAVQSQYKNNSAMLRLRVLGTDATLETLSADGNTIYNSLRISDPTTNRRGSSSLANTEGYVSILSASGYHTIESFSITPIVGDFGVGEAQTQVNFAEESSLDNFLAYYTQSSDYLAPAIAQDMASQWALSDQGSLLRIDGLGTNVDGSVSHLFWKDETFKYFEATIVYRNKTGNAGFMGFEFGLESYSDRFIDVGHGAFMQMNGVPTLTGVNKTVMVLYEEGVASNYDLYGWHTFRLRVTANNVLFYVDDMKTPLYSTQITDVQEGYLGIISTGLTQLELRSFSINRLNADGEVIE